MGGHYDLPELIGDLDRLVPGLDTTALPSLVQFHQLLEAGNQAGNLTRIVDWPEFLVKHALDSLLGVAAFPELKDGALRVIDVGCGPGIPGVLLALVCPACQFVEIDSTRRKVDFVNEAIGELQLGDRCQALHARARELARQPGQLGTYDLIIARAVASAGDLIRECRRLLNDSGSILLYKTPSAIEEELPLCRREAAKAGLTVILSPVYDLPGEEGQRQFFILRRAS